MCMEWPFIKLLNVKAREALCVRRGKKENTSTAFMQTNDSITNDKTSPVIRGPGVYSGLELVRGRPERRKSSNKD